MPIKENSAKTRDHRHLLRISNHNFHDATLDQINVVPARSKRHKARIEVLLSYPRVELGFSILFTGCTNVSLKLDFDVLADNLEYNTAGFSILQDAKKIQEFITSQISFWNIEYDDIGPKSSPSYSSRTSPLKSKIAKVDILALHRISYFGGELAVIAASHKIRRIKLQTQLA